MATANTVFIIYDTAGLPIAAIQPNTLNGPGGVQQNSDLSLFGQGYALWGAASDQNDYRLIENFACPESVINPTPTQPMGVAELGAGNGINVPIIGQLWFNTTRQQMYTFTNNGWVNSSIGVTVGVNPPPLPVEGELWYNTNIPQLEVYNGSAFVSVAALYLPLAGGTMTGVINMGGNNITNAGTVTANVVTTSATTAANGVTSNQITIPNSGATTLADGPRIGPYIIYHTGNLNISTFVQGMIMMWNSSVPPTGWALCDGGTYAGISPPGPVVTPDLRDRFVIGAGGSFSPSYGGTGGATNITGSTSSYSHSHGGATAGYTLTIPDMPAHSHAVYGVSAPIEYSGGSGTLFLDISGGTGSYYTNQTGGALAQLIQNTGGGGSHAHAIATDLHNHNITISAVPPYYGLFFIMKL